MAQMNTLSIDIETYSDIDLKKCGVYRYASSPNADLLLFGYSIDNGPVEVIDVAQGEKIPEYILKALSDNGVTKWAYNSNFERVFLSVWLKRNYGPKFVENIVQAISRDLLMSAMKTLSHCFICGHVHDELIIECSPDASLDELCRQMTRVPDWMQGLKLDAAGYVTPWYCKD